MADEQKKDETVVTVTYWAGRGRAEPTRLLLAAAGVKFNNVFLTLPKEIADLRASGKLAYDQLPLVEMDGLNLVQTGAQFRYIADKYKLRGSNVKEAYLVDLVYEGTKDARGPLMGYQFHEDADKLVQEFNDKRFCKKWEELLSDEACAKDGYFIGKASAADVAVFEVLEFLQLAVGDDKFNEIMKAYPKLLNNYGVSRKIGGIEEYIANGRNHKSWSDYVKDVNTTLGR
eukprot:CAMPEP_0197029762 /NCGR_PEP_ID=MMETSP1384-20130603/9150_1 /TAXON_ID=29189 /ORGANISM="Ammonia sp." /LENGTH=229 /DNA_ID=CAMNT_0042458993 /DNA_START=46 /DNA_END=735 /DNA_ORIENTATION=-